MSDDKKNKKVKKPLETNISIGYTDETAANAGNIESSFVVVDNTYRVVKGEDEERISYTIDLDNNKIYEIYNLITHDKVTYNDNAQSLLPYALNTMQEELNSGKDITQIHSDLIQSINSKKSNPAEVYNIITYLETQLLNLYDKNVELKDLGKNSQEMLSNILATQRHENLSGFVCMNIHEFGMRLLHDCGINAVVISGKSMASGSHACLLYQLEDGKFAFTNYNRTVIINAKNIKEASMVVNKACKATGLESFGTIQFLDDNCSYHEFALKDETVWGNEIDKRDHNFESPCNFTMDGKTAIDGSFNTSNLGSFSGTIQGTLAYGNNNIKHETTLAISMQKRGQTALFDSSQSTGIKVGHKFVNNKNGLFMSAQAIVAQTSGNVEIGQAPDRTIIDVTASSEGRIKEHKENEVNYNDLDENVKNDINAFYRSKHVDNPYTGEKNPKPKPEPKPSETGVEKPDEQTTTVQNPQIYTTKHTTVSLQGKIGKNFELLDTQNTQLNNITQASFIGYINNATTGDIANRRDFRFSLEDGFQFTNSNQNSIFKTYASGGIVGDYKHTGGSQTGGIQFGMKFNTGIEAGLNLNNNWSVGASADAYLVETKPTTENGLMTRLNASYKPSNSNVSFFGNVSMTREKQQLRIGGFDQLAEDTRNIGVTIGMQNPNGRISLNYNNNINKINSTYNKQNISLNVSTTPQYLFKKLGFK